MLMPYESHFSIGLQWSHGMTAVLQWCFVALGVRYRISGIQWSELKNVVSDSFEHK